MAQRGQEAGLVERIIRYIPSEVRLPLLTFDVLFRAEHP